MYEFSYVYPQDQSDLMLHLSHLGDPRNAFLIYFPLSFCLHKPTGEKVLWLAALAEWINAILKWWVLYLNYCICITVFDILYLNYCIWITICLLGNILCFCCCQLAFLKINFSEKFFQE